MEERLSEAHYAKAWKILVYLLQPDEVHRIALADINLAFLL